MGEWVNLPADGDPKTPCLAMRPRATARALGVSERTLWSWTQQGDVPHVRIGKTILYPVDGLRRWLDERAAKAADDLPPGDGATGDDTNA